MLTADPEHAISVILDTMKPNQLPTAQEIERLTAFLPRLYSEGFSSVGSWAGGEKGKDGSISFPYPNYNPVVEEFFRLVSSEGWLDHEYNPEQAYQMLINEKLIKTASLSQIKTMLTFCVRGERFSDGHWAQMIEGGHIRRLLERLNEIKSEQMK
jgi:hypothetical protein